MNEIILEVKDLYKNYGKLEAVRGTSFEIKKGQCFGLLGPNGAGKSTTIEIIENIIKPTSGTILYKGNPLDSSYLEELGIQFQETSLLAQLTVKETLETFRRFYKNQMDLEEIIDTCQLRPFLNQKHEKVSGGQRQRLLLAMALCNDPNLLLLDEPTTGLDPQARRHLWEIVKKIKQKGKSIILTTHYMEEAYELCDEIAIMDHGKIIAQGKPEELLAQYFSLDVIKLPKLDTELLSGDFFTVYDKGDYVEIHTEKTDLFLKYCFEKNINLKGISIRKSNLEDLFLELTGKEIRG